MKKKGQISTELLVIIIFIIMLFIPAIIYVYYKTTELNENVESLKAKLFSSKLAYTANSLGFMGEGNALKVEFTLPPSVRSLEFKDWGQGGEVLITLNDGTQLSQFTKFPLKSSDTYPGGADYKLEFVSENGEISIYPSK